MRTIKYVLLILLLVNGVYGYSQNLPFIIKDKYCGKGVILSLEKGLPFIIESDSRLFTPSLEDVKLAENYLLSNNVDVKFDISVINFYNPRKLKNQFNKYNRQYVGYINKVSDKIIIVHLLNFKRKKNAQEMFKNWEKEYVIGLGEFYEKNTKTFLINLTKKEVSIF